MDIAAGVYRHYKPHDPPRDYLVLGMAHDANNASREVVVYVPLYVDPTQTGPRLAVRTVEDFLAHVDPSTGGIAAAGEVGSQPRFRFIGPR